MNTMGRRTRTETKAKENPEPSGDQGKKTKKIREAKQTHTPDFAMLTSLSSEATTHTSDREKPERLKMLLSPGEAQKPER